MFPYLTTSKQIFFPCLINLWVWTHSSEWCEDILANKNQIKYSESEPKRCRWELFQLWICLEVCLIVPVQTVYQCLATPSWVMWEVLDPSFLKCSDIILYDWCWLKMVLHKVGPASTVSSLTYLLHCNNLTHSIPQGTLSTGTNTWITFTCS